jgi:ABC-type antimicrobial peptide transport system permease subunit
MIKNYFKLGLRSLAKNRLSSLINILGLALAVGCCMVVFEFFDWSMHMDSFHHKLNNLFVIERVVEKNGNEQLWGNSPSPMGPMLKSDFPQIKNTARLNYVGVVIRKGDNVFRETVTFADDSFYNMFDFPVKWGNKEHFTDPDGIVLTDKLSQKLFGKENPVGKNISVRFDNNGKENIVNFTIKGVFDKQPVESSFFLASLVPHSKMISLGMDKPGDWSQTTEMTFLEADNETALAPVQKLSKKYIQLYNDANKDDKIAAFHFQPLNTMNFHAWKVSRHRFAETHIAGYIMLAVIAIATLLLVYFNYMNIAIASASTRLKEIGVRKVMGSSRKQVIFQFLLENMILCTIAVAAGLLLAKFIFVPWFEQIATVEFSQNMFANYRTWVALVILIIVSALGGASYPSFYISAFKAINIMKGNSKMGSRNRFRKSLLGLQFFLTFLAISIAIAFVQESKHVKARPWGYAPENNVVVTLDKSADFDAFKNELKNSGIVKSVTGAAQPLGYYTRQLVIKTEGKEQTVQSMGVLPGFAKQLGINVTKGRDLNEQFKTDQTDAVLVNQAFIHQMHWQTGIGKNIEYEHHLYQIVGEVNDFHYDDFGRPVGPMLLMGCKPSDVSYVYVKTSPGLFTNVHGSVEKIWKKVNPNLPFDYHYQDNVFEGYFSSFVQVSQVMGAASLIMIVISITGIFGLALLIIGKKMKEISVRKVLGAGIGTIVYLVNKEFVFAILFALLLGLPVSWLLTRTLYNQIEPDLGVSLTPLILSLMSLVIMTAISVSWHIYKAHTSNPTKYLKDE